MRRKRKHAKRIPVNTIFLVASILILLLVVFLGKMNII